TAEKADITLLDAAGNDLMSLAFQNYSSRRADDLKYIIDGLVEKGLTIKTAYEGGNTLAHYAVKKNSMYLLEKAIELGVDLNLKNDLGITSLHLAAMKAHDNELIDKLLAAGANKNILTEFEESTYQLASENELLAKNKVDIKQLRMDD
ncbi:MAG: ankyrin repeat domain-containing protein, partial [Bacteroidota bacterium]